MLKKLAEAGGIEALRAAGPAPVEAPAGLDLRGKHVVVLSKDTLRAQRAVEAIEAAGGAALHCTWQESLDVVGQGLPDMLLVDMGREASAVEPLLPELAQLLDGGLLVLSAVADAKMRTRLEALDLGARFSRAVPGDPDTLALLAR